MRCSKFVRPHVRGHVPGQNRPGPALPRSTTAGPRILSLHAVHHNELLLLDPFMENQISNPPNLD